MDNLLGFIVSAAVAIFYIAATWRIFEKAGQPGWMAIIPILNLFVLVTIAGKPWWWFLLLFIPLVNLIVIFLVLHGVSENFGQGMGFTLGLFFLGFIFIPILGFGGAEYMGRKAKYSY